MSKIKTLVDRISSRNILLFRLFDKLLGRNNKIYNKGKGKAVYRVKGKGNSITVGKGTKLRKTVFLINGNNNHVVIGENCFIGNECSFWMEGNDIKIMIGDQTSFTQLVHVNAQENNSAIFIGKDCMLSNHIIIRTSDSHPIYDAETGKRLNPAKNITIGEHVWIAPNSKIMKGVSIGDGSIIGSDTMVTKDIPKNVLAVGHPAKAVKTNIKWTRESLF